MTLADLLHPLAVSDFLVEHFGVRPVHVAGAASRFAGFGCDESNPHITALCRDLERTLEAPVRYDRHTEWHGHELHRRTQDSFVLQIGGHAGWSLRGKALTPSEGLTWQGTLGAGNALYLPRGWWCSATPQRPGGSVLVLSIDNPTGADLLDWLAGQLRKHETLGADLPRFGSPAARAEYLLLMRRGLDQILQSPALLEQYFRHRDTGPLHPDPSTVSVLWREDLPSDYQIVLVSRRHPRIRRLNETEIYLSVTGRDLPFPIGLAAPITYILDKMPISLAHFYHRFDEIVDRVSLSRLLAILSANGIVTFAAPDEMA